MDVGMVGLGRMGANMAERLVRGGHRVVGYDLSPDAAAHLAGFGAQPTPSLADLVAALPAPRAVWVMLPAGKPVDETLAALLPLVAAGDTLIDGGNSNFHDTLRRAEQCRRAGCHLVDVGTSGGVWGLAEGYSMMVGGDETAVDRLTPLFETLAPAPDRGWGRVGPSGAGHFVKMIHNGIEYGLMEAYAEGFAILKAKREWDLDLPGIAQIWRWGSVIRSWLLDLTAAALADDPDLSGVAPFVPDSGEGRWTVLESLDLEVPAPVIALSLMQRIESRDSVDYADRLLAVMRGRFGGHPVKSEEAK
jgi:6-phosphogluconate dehydrogenase